MATLEIEATAREPQHLAALRRANTVRLAAAAVKREMGDGTITLKAALDDERAQPVAIMDLLMAQRRWGTMRAAKVLRGLMIAENKRVEALTDRQRRVIAEACS